MPHTTKNQELISYNSNDGKISFNVNVFEETVWLTQKQMAELFGVESHTINYHLKGIFKDKELHKISTTRIFRAVAEEGNRKVARDLEHYNLDVIICVGYRVNSARATNFRIWATGIIKQYLLGGYAINEQRIKSLEEKIDNLSTDLRKELKDEIRQINKSLLEIANRPITINNQISLASHKLEEKCVELLDEIIGKIKDEKTKVQLEEVKKDIKATTKDQKTKNNIISFFTKLGDKNSNLHKSIAGAQMSKRIITELVKLGEKLKDLIF
jgi:hypothetical protein